MYPLKNAKGSNALLPIFVNLKSNTMKKSHCKDKAYFGHLQDFSQLFAVKICFITYFCVFAFDL
jgi:hypothetical protein